MKRFRIVPAPLVLALGAAASLLAPASAPAATLRAASELREPRVYLRDLFDDAGLNANRLLGPGPGPGGHIVVEARQLRAIARQYDVDWEPVSNAERAVLAWPGRPLGRDEALAAVRTALVGRGAAPDCEIEIPGFTPPIVPLGASPRPVVTQMDYDAALGRFTAVLSVTGEGMEPIAARIGGQVADVLELPVAAARLQAGAVAGPRDIRTARVRVALIHAEVARDPAAVIGMQLKRQIAAGAPVPVADLMRPTQVGRGEPVRMQLQVEGLSLSGQGVALESGAAGERIRVRNTSSQTVIEAEVLGPGAVRVLPGTAPLTAQARSGLPAGLAGGRGG